MAIQLDREQHAKTLRSIVEKIFWPAAAGNVFWVLCNLLLNKNTAFPDVAPNMILLFLVTVYLVINWARQHVGDASKNASIRFWYFDILHLLAIVITANAAIYRSDLLPWFLGSQFLITVAGHSLGAWEVSGDDALQKHGLALVNLLGVLFLIILGVIGVSSTWNATIVLGIVLILWIVGRRQEFVELIGFKRNGQTAQE